MKIVYGCLCSKIQYFLSEEEMVSKFKLIRKNTMPETVQKELAKKARAIQK